MAHEKMSCTGLYEGLSMTEPTTSLCLGGAKQLMRINILSDSPATINEACRIATIAAER